MHQLPLEEGLLACETSALMGGDGKVRRMRVVLPAVATIVAATTLGATVTVATASTDPRATTAVSTHPRAKATAARSRQRARAARAHSLIDPAASCGVSRKRDPKDRLKVVGRRLKDTDGNVIVPEGISIVGGPEERDYAAAEASTDAQIDAAHAAWHVNSLRLQVSESDLLGQPTPGYGYDRPFADYLSRIICRILSYHEIPIVNDNTWFTGGQPDPTSTTVAFWDYMSVNYRRSPVIFDLFNEPRLKRTRSGRPLGNARIWRLWKRGGTVSGVHYIGMQSLVTDIRKRFHAGNVIWVESAYETSHTADLPGHLLSGSNLMYSFHKLRLNEPATWYAVGKLAARGIALVDGEWAQYAALDRPWECYGDAYTSAPAYLAYWKRESVGIEAWSLQYGSLAQAEPGAVVHDGNYGDFPTDAASLEVPNSMSSDYGCNAQSLGQGAGSLVMSYFKQNTAAAPRALFASGS